MVATVLVSPLGREPLIVVVVAWTVFGHARRMQGIVALGLWMFHGNRA